MSKEETIQSIERIFVACVRNARKLADAQRGPALIEAFDKVWALLEPASIKFEYEEIDEAGLATALRQAADALVFWSTSPDALMAAFALLYMAADHLELGSPVSIGDQVAANFDHYTNRLIQG